MKYADGLEVLLGDKVSLGGGMTGVVVAAIDSDNYSTTDLRRDWSYLSHGVLVQSSEAGMVHFSGPDADLQLIRRSQSFD
jgi:hypothetical protein